jgi:transketolase
MRTAFVETLTNLMRKHEDLIVLTADMGFSVFEEMQKEFPKRFMNTGVTEQSTIGVATGLALSGYKVFVYAQASFVTMRCFEQVRLDVAYNNVNVKLVGVAAGFSLNQLGVSHFAVEDVALMRTLPGMTVLTPGDPLESKWATEKAYETSGPCYIRLTKSNCPLVHKNFSDIEIGKGVKMAEGKDFSLFVSGSLLPQAWEVVSVLRKKGKSGTLISMPSVKPLDKNLILSEAKKTKNIFTLEEHSIIGGLGSAVAELLAESNVEVFFKRLGVPDHFTKITGSQEYLRGVNGLSVQQITGIILEFLSRIK